MTIYVIKPDRDVDLYVGWDPRAGGPVWIGTRDEAEGDGVHPGYLEDADQWGSNCSSEFGRWDWPGFHAEADLPEARWLPRERLAAYVTAVFEERFEDALALTALEGATL